MARFNTFRGLSLLLPALILSGQVLGQGSAPHQADTGMSVRRTLLVDQLVRATFPMANLPDPEKHHWPKALAGLYKHGPSDSISSFRLRRFVNRAPFHFTLLGYTRMLMQYGQNDSVARYRQRYLDAVWARRDSYNAWTGEGTENHLNMNRTSGYLLAQASLSDPVRYPEAATRLAQMRQTLAEHMKRVYQMGTGEWNSSIYQTYNVAGYLNLYDFAQDPAVKDMARAVLDYYALEVALHASGGSTAGAEMRGNLSGNTVSSNDYLAWYWFGITNKDATQASFWQGREYSQVVHAALSSYRPPRVLYDLINDQQARVYLGNLADYQVQRQAQHLRTLYRQPGMTLGSAQLNYGGWTNACLQIMPWKLIVEDGAANGDHAVITGSGLFWPILGGRFRMPFEQISQHEGVLIQLTVPPDSLAQLRTQIPSTISRWASRWQADFLQRFPPPNDLKDGGNPVRAPQFATNPRMGSYISFPTRLVSTAHTAPGLYILPTGSSYVVIRRVHGRQAAPTDTVEMANRRMIRDFPPTDSLGGFILETTPQQQWVSVTALADSLARRPLSIAYTAQGPQVRFRDLNNRIHEVTYQQSGPRYTEPIFDWGYGVQTQQTDAFGAPWEQPVWPAIHTGRVPLHRVNGRNHPISRDPSCVFIDQSASPAVRLCGSVLTITPSAGGTYVVDFRGQRPIFSDTPLSISKAEHTRQPRLRLYPNPARARLRFEVLEVKGISGQSPFRATLLDAQGRQVQGWSGRLDARQGAPLSLDRHAKGVYTLRVSVAEQTLTERLTLD